MICDILVIYFTLRFPIFRLYLCQILSYHNKANLFSFHVMYKCQFKKNDPYDWFCGPGLHLLYALWKKVQNCHQGDTLSKSTDIYLDMNHLGIKKVHKYVPFSFCTLRYRPNDSIVPFCLRVYMSYSIFCEILKQKTKPNHDIHCMGSVSACCCNLLPVNVTSL